MHNRFASTGLLLLSILAPSFAIGCKKPPPPEAEVPTATAAASAAPVALTRQPGDLVDVQWNSSWWKGKILSAQDGKYRVHYIGWGANWDENVAPERVRDQTADAKVGSSAEPDSTAATAAAAATSTPAPAPAPASTAATFAVGSKVDVNWKGTWYQAKILSKSATGYRVHYIGWASSWDENVTASRVRKFTGSASKGSIAE